MQLKRIPAAMLAAPLAASMLLTGCGDTGKQDASAPSATSTSPASAATSATPTTTGSATGTASQATDPDIPAAARAHTIAGAEAFVRYYFERVNVAWTVPRAGILSPLCQASSTSCANTEKTATRLAREGHRYDGDPVSVKFIGVLDTRNPNKFIVLANLVQERRSEIDRAGKIYVTDKRKDLRVNIALLYIGHAWSVAGIQSIK